MKMTSLLGVLSIAAVVGIILSQALRGEESRAQTVAGGTNGITATGVNRQPERSLPAGISPNSAFAELVSLVHAGVEPSVILKYIDNTLRLFELDADDIIYLSDLGAPAEVINAAMEHDRQLIEKGIPSEAGPQEAPPTEDVAEDIDDPPEEVTVNYFYHTLAPYGVWVDIDGYGRCWRPTVAVYNTGWQPYCDNGHWVYTDHGWYWVSGYSWGRSTFHYGRWFHHSHHGWCWWPDTYWAPSWVCWRYDRNYCGWAPLPPHAVYRPGTGFVYYGSSVTVGFNFGLNAGAFTFVAIRDLCDPNPGRKRIDHREAVRIYDSTTTFHEIKYDRSNRRISNSGIPPRNITAVTRQEIRPVSVRHAQGGVMRSRSHDERARNGKAQAVDRSTHVSSQAGAPAAARSNVQPPRHSSETSKARNEQQNQSRKSGDTKNPARSTKPSSPQAPQTQRQQTAAVTPRPQAYKTSDTPQKNHSNHQVRKQAQKKNSYGSPPQAGKSSNSIKKTSPSTPPKEKVSMQGMKPDQRKQKVPPGQSE